MGKNKIIDDNWYNYIPEASQTKDVFKLQLKVKILDK